MKSISVLGHLTLIACSFSVASFGGELFNPKDTYALVTGIIEWEDSSISTFPSEGRKDREFKNALIRRGIPKDNIIYLEDREGTRQNILNSLKTLLAKATKSSTFIFYFSGHGTLDNKEFYMVNYDFDSNKIPTSGLSATSIEKEIGDHFKGHQVFLFSDACFSGSLDGIAEKLNEKSNFVTLSLTSVNRTSLSTGAWTYTEALIDAFDGVKYLDTDNDQHISFRELRDFIRDEMDFVENQMTEHLNRSSREDLFLLAPIYDYQIVSYAQFQRGEFVLVNVDGTSILGRVLQSTSSGQYEIKLIDRRVVWAIESELSVYVPQSLPVGTKVLAPFPRPFLFEGTVIQVRGRYHLVKLDKESLGETAWFAFDHLVPVAGATTAPHTMEFF